ncbi:hypothetical protein BC834DRAFT_893814 [Gloeopeniophorella convolvens]|nr:hypothetical protein BC834DRAFT_893814 [Gloeopeniophorella convolvens]
MKPMKNDSRAIYIPQPLEQSRNATARVLKIQGTGLHLCASLLHLALNTPRTITECTLRCDADIGATSSARLAFDSDPACALPGKVGAAPFGEMCLNPPNILRTPPHSHALHSSPWTTRYAVWRIATVPSACGSTEPAHIGR